MSQNCPKNEKSPICLLYKSSLTHCYIWRRGRDSNPGILSDQRFSRPPLSTAQPPLRFNLLLTDSLRRTAHWSQAAVPAALFRAPALHPYRAVLRTFKFAPGKFVDRSATSPIQSVVDVFAPTVLLTGLKRRYPPRYSGHPALHSCGAALHAFKFAPGEFVDRSATSPIQSIVDGFAPPYCSLVSSGGTRRDIPGYEIHCVFRPAGRI